MIAVYVSGHGFGHSTRTAEVLRTLRERAPSLPITVSTSAPAFLFEGIVAPPTRGAAGRVRRGPGAEGCPGDRRARDRRPLAGVRGGVGRPGGYRGGVAEKLGSASGSRRHPTARLRGGGRRRRAFDGSRQLLLGLDLRARSLAGACPSGGGLALPRRVPPRRASPAAPFRRGPRGVLADRGRTAGGPSSRAVEGGGPPPTRLRPPAHRLAVFRGTGPAGHRSPDLRGPRRLPVRPDRGLR